MFSLLRKICLKIKRKFFYHCFGFYPEYVRRLVYLQKYLEKEERKDSNYNEYIKDYFNDKRTVR